MRATAGDSDRVAIGNAPASPTPNRKRIAIIDPAFHAAAVSDVSLEVQAGEFLTFLGPSGCGKTTTLRSVMGLLPPKQGRIRFGGRDVAGLAPEAIADGLDVGAISHANIDVINRTVDDVAFVSEEEIASSVLLLLDPQLPDWLPTITLRNLHVGSHRADARRGTRVPFDEADLPGTVVFIFQPAEENPPPGEKGGAPQMVVEGALANPKPEAIFGLHVWPDSAGRITYRPKR